RVARPPARAARPRPGLMPEPCGALAPQPRAAMQRLLLDVLAPASATVVFVTHDVDEALLLGHRVVVLGGSGVAAEFTAPVSRDEVLAALGAPTKETV